MLKHSHCYVCDLNNPLGLQVAFYLEGRRAVGQFIPRTEHESFEHITHGGILSALLDAAMTRVLLFHSIKAKTARLQIRFRKEAKVGEPLTVLGEVVLLKKLFAVTRGEIKDSQDNSIARGEAIFILQKEEKETSSVHQGRK